mmetsp:Transcript_2666/g.5949  ORF Transcript_2666/g.5949 Transcript_2666/m.5949 type:complete len:211 (-) Transcript_2666:298-930(-)
MSICRRALAPPKQPSEPRVLLLLLRSPRRGGAAALCDVSLGGDFARPAQDRSQLISVEEASDLFLVVLAPNKHDLLPSAGRQPMLDNRPHDGEDRRRVEQDTESHSLWVVVLKGVNDGLVELHIPVRSGKPRQVKNDGERLHLALGVELPHKLVHDRHDVESNNVAVGRVMVAAEVKVGLPTPLVPTPREALAIVVCTPEALQRGVLLRL